MSLQTITEPNNLVLYCGQFNCNSITASNTNFSSSTDATSTSTGAIVINGGLGVGLDQFIGGNLSVDGNITCSDIIYEQIINVGSTADATSTSTGAIICAGGVGIAKSAYISNLRVINTTDSTDRLTGSTVLSGGLGVNGSANFGGFLNVTNTIREFNTSDSTSTSTGSLLVLGGVGIAKKASIGSDLNINGILYQLNTNDSVSSTTGCAVFAGGLGIKKSLYIDGVQRITNTQGSTSTSTGALSIAGGLSVQSGSQFIAPLTVLSTNLTPASLTNYMYQSYGNVASSLQNNIQNLNSAGSSDYIMTSDIGDDVSSYVDIGQNGSTNNSGLGGICDGYVYAQSSSIGTGNIGGNLYIASPNASTCIYLSTGISNTNIMSIGTNVNVLPTSDSTSTSSGSLVVNGGVGIAKSLVVGNGNNATNTLTGSLQVNGGLSVANDVQIGGTYYGNFNFGTNQSTSTSTGSLIVAGGIGVNGNLYVGENENISGIVTISNTTNATSSSTGALLVTGGVGIEGGLYVDNSASRFKTITFTNQMNCGTSPSGLIYFSSTGDMNFNANATLATSAWHMYGNVSGGGNSTCWYMTNDAHAHFQGTHDSTSTGTGALQILGGVGCGKSMNIGGSLNVYNTNNATSVSTGSLQVLGGVGINNDLYVGGNLYSLNYTSVIINPFVFTNSSYDTQTVNTIVTFVQENNVVMCNIQEFGLIFYSAGYLVSSSQVPSGLKPNSSSTLTTCYTDTNGTYNILGSAQIDNSLRLITICNGMFQSGGLQPTWTNTSNTTTIHQFTFVYHI